MLMMDDESWFDEYIDLDLLLLEFGAGMAYLDWVWIGAFDAVFAMYFLFPLRIHMEGWRDTERWDSIQSRYQYRQTYQTPNTVNIPRICQFAWYSVEFAIRAYVFCGLTLYFF